MQWYFHDGLGAYTNDRISPEDIEISEPPSSQHTWDGSGWIVDLKPDWVALTNDFAGSAVFAKIWVAADGTDATTIAALKKAMNAGKAFALIQTSLQTQRLPDLEFAIASLRQNLSEIASIGDFTAEELDWINGLLETHQFPFRLS